MCVILSTFENHKPSLDVLEACERANPHGGGIAWREGKLIHWEKSITAREIHKIVEKKRGPFLIHFRIASIGPVSPELCHPFPVSGLAACKLSGRSHSVLAQNGTWSSWRETTKRVAIATASTFPDGPMSDARAAAWMVAQLGEHAFGSMAGKFCHFTRRGMRLYGEWHKMRGWNASNLGWRNYL